MASTEVKKKKRPSGMVHFAAGGIGGMAGAILTCPLEVVKTRMQSSYYTEGKVNLKAQPNLANSVSFKSLSEAARLVSHSSRYSPFPPLPLFPVPAPMLSTAQGTSEALYWNQSLLETAHHLHHQEQQRLLNNQRAFSSTIVRWSRGIYNIFYQPVAMLQAIYQNEGGGALWKGIGPNLAGIIPSRAVHFSTYVKGKEFFTELYGGVETSLVHLSAAAVAGVSVATITCPIWVIKTRMQLQLTPLKGKSNGVGMATMPESMTYKNSWDCLKKVARNEGLKGLYKGLGASYLGVFESTLQFVLYERMKLVMVRHRNSHRQSLFPREFQEWFDYFVIAAGSKFIAAIITYPHEVVRTRLREPPLPGRPPKYRGIIPTVSVILREEGFRAFYGGVGAHLLRVVPNAAIVFLGYEMVVKFFD